MVHEGYQRQRGIGCALGLIVGILLMPVVYVLSTGPMVWLVYHAGVPKSVMVIYFPLRLIGSFLTIAS